MPRFTAPQVWGLLERPSKHPATPLDTLPLPPQIMALVELTRLRHAYVGVPGVSGLSVEQRKRLTLAGG